MMTPRQYHAACFIRDYMADYGYSPTYAEIAAGIGNSRARVEELIRQLEERGVIRRVAKRPRALQVIVDLPTPRKAVATPRPAAPIVPPVAAPAAQTRSPSGAFKSAAPPLARAQAPATVATADAGIA